MLKIRPTIQFKILATSAILLGLGAAVLGVAAKKAAHQVSEHIGSTLAATTEGIADRVSRTVFDRAGDVKAFALNDAARNKANWGNFDDNNPLIKAMNECARAYDIYSLTVLVDTAGKVVAVNSKDPSGKPVDTKAIRGQTYAGAQWFQDVMADRYFGGPADSIGAVIEDVAFNEDMKRVYGNDGLAMGFAAPVRDDAGKTIAVWHNLADFRFIEEILADAVQQQVDGDNPTAEVTLLNQEGVVWSLASRATIKDGEVRRDDAVLGKVNLAASGSSSIKKALAGETGCVLSERDGAGLARTSAYTFRRPVLGFSGMPWAILIRLEASDALDLEATITTTVWGGTIASIALCLVGTFFAIRTFMRPIRFTVSRMENIATGDGDLTQRLDETRRDETGDLARAFNLFTEKMRGVIGEVLDSAGDVAASSTQISGTTEMLASGVSEQQNRATRISAAVDESSASIGEVARRSAEATQFAEKAGQEAAAGGNEVNGAIRSIETVATEVEKAAQAIGELGAKSEQIGTIITVIDDIAEKTNLLALNAAIEAARAGEHGKGFAVVADEVRKLAERTQNATGEIAKSIKTIQTETLQAVDRMKDGSQQVHGSVEQARRAGATLERIVSSSQDVATMVRAIAATAEQQAQATDEISKAVSEIAVITSKFSSSTEETSSATAQLSAKAEQLRRMVEKFKIERRTHGERFAGSGVESTAGRVLDISATGARLSLASNAEVDPAGMTLTLRSGTTSAQVRGTPRWQRTTAAGREIGLQFDAPPASLGTIVKAAANRDSKVATPLRRGK